jgi:hypothetical protein
MADATPSGNWKIERQVDRITGAPLPSAQLITRTSSNSRVPAQHPAGLQLTCFDRQPLVRLSFEFKVGAEKDTILGYRFDDRPGRDDVKARILGGHQVIVIEDRATVADFISGMSGAKVLYVRVRSLGAGRTTAEFRLDGADAAVQAAFANCPLSSDNARRRTS